MTSETELWLLITNTDSVCACILAPLGDWSGLYAYLSVCVSVWVGGCGCVVVWVHVWCVCRYGRCGIYNLHVLCVSLRE